MITILITIMIFITIIIVIMIMSTFMTRKMTKIFKILISTIDIIIIRSQIASNGFFSLKMSFFCM